MVVQLESLVTNVSLQKLLPTKLPSDHPRGDDFFHLKRSRRNKPPYKKGVRKERTWWLDLWNGWICLFVKLEALSCQLATKIIQLWGRVGTGKREFLESLWKVKICGVNKPTSLHFSECRGFIQKKRERMKFEEVGSICQGVGNFITTLVFRKWFLSPFSARFSWANLRFCNLIRWVFGRFCRFWVKNPRFAVLDAAGSVFCAGAWQLLAEQADGCCKTAAWVDQNYQNSRKTWAILR